MQNRSFWTHSSLDRMFFKQWSQDITISQKTLIAECSYWMVLRIMLPAFRSSCDSNRHLMTVLHCVFYLRLKTVWEKMYKLKKQIFSRFLTPWLAPYPTSICLYRRIAADGAFRRIIWDITNDGWRPTQRRFLCPDLFVTKCTNRVPKRRKRDCTYLSITMYLYYVPTWLDYFIYVFFCTPDKGMEQLEKVNICMI